MAVAYQLPNGSTVAQSKSLSAPVAITAATNAAECVLTLASAPAGLKVGDYVVISSAWIELDNMIARVKAYAADTKAVTLENISTLDKTRFPAGSGLGSLSVVTDWVFLPYITGVAISGGDQQNTTIQPLQLNKALTLNTFKAGRTQTFTLTHNSKDEIRPYAKTADINQDLVAVKFYNPRAKEDRVYTAQVSFNDMPTTDVNAVETVTLAYNLQCDQQFYDVA